MKTSYKITISILATALISAGVFSALSYHQSRTVLQEAAYSDVAALRDAKAVQIEAFFKQKASHTDKIAHDPIVAKALSELQTSFRKINQGGETVLADESAIVRDYYERRILPRIAKFIGEKNASYDTYGPKTRAARHLQNQFIVQPPSEKAPRRNTYAETHQKHHAALKALAQTHGFSDLALIDVETGYIIYSVSKDIDFGSDIYTGAFENTALGNAVKRAKNESSLISSDIDLYIPAGGGAAAFIASPVYQDDIPIGLVATRFDAAEVSALSTSGIKGRRDRDVYLVGGDYMMRSNAPFAQENLNAYIRLIQDKGEPEAITSKVKLQKSTILAQSAKSDSVRAALRGETGAMMADNYLGNSVVSAYAPVKAGENDWVIVAERDAGDLFAPLNPMAKQMLIAAAIFFPLLILLALWLARSIMRPAREFLRTAIDLVEGDDVRFAEGRTEFGRIGAEMNKFIEHDPWSVTLKPRRKKKPIKLMAFQDAEDNVPDSAIEPAPEPAVQAVPAPKVETPLTPESVKPAVMTMSVPQIVPAETAKAMPLKAETTPDIPLQVELTRAEKRAAAKAEKRAKILAERQAKETAAEKKVAEKKAQIETERIARAAEREKAEAARQAKRDAEIKAREDARLKAEADRKAKADTEAKARAEKQAKLDAERKAKADERAKIEAQKQAKVETELAAKAEAREKAIAEKQAKIDARERVDSERRAAAEADRKTKAASRAKAEAEKEAKAAAAEKSALADAKARSNKQAKLDSIEKMKADAQARKERLQAESAARREKSAPLKRPDVKADGAPEIKTPTKKDPAPQIDPDVKAKVKADANPPLTTLSSTERPSSPELSEAPMPLDEPATRSRLRRRRR